MQNSGGNFFASIYWSIVFFWNLKNVLTISQSPPCFQRKFLIIRLQGSRKSPIQQLILIKDTFFLKHYFLLQIEKHKLRLTVKQSIKQTVATTLLTHFCSFCDIFAHFSLNFSNELLTAILKHFNCYWIVGICDFTKLHSQKSQGMRSWWAILVAIS